MPENLKRLDRDNGDRMDDRQEVLSLLTVATSSSSSSAVSAGTKRRAEQDAELPRTGTRRNPDPDYHGDQGNVFIVYTVDEEADLERFLIGFHGVVEDHCDDDDKSIEVKQRWADVEDTDTDDMRPDAV